MIKTGFIWSPEYTKFSLGKGHPMNPNRLIILNQLLKSAGIFEKSEVSRFAPRMATEDDLSLFHTPEYISTMKTVSQVKGESVSDSHLKFGLGTMDCPIFPEMHELVSLVVGGTLEGVKRIMTGEVQQVFAFLGGMHHAFPDRAAGFCYYNDVVVAIRYLQEKHRMKRILYIDTDVHHGDGVLDAFYSMNNVLGISIHESGQFIFPPTGFPDEIGEGIGLGYTINLPLFPGTWDDLYIELFESIIPCVWEKYDPEFVIWQCGVDGHFKDTLGHLNLTTNVFSYLGHQIAGLTRKGNAQGKLLMLSGGGYNPESAARAWFALVTNVMEMDAPSASPQDWIEFCQEKFDLEVKATLSDDIINIQSIEKRKTTLEELNIYAGYKPSVIEETNRQYLQKLKEGLCKTPVWNECCEDFL